MLHSACLQKLVPHWLWFITDTWGASPNSSRLNPNLCSGSLNCTALHNSTYDPAPILDLVLIPHTDFWPRLRKNNNDSHARQAIVMWQIHQCSPWSDYFCITKDVRSIVCNSLYITVIWSESVYFSHMQKVNSESHPLHLTHHYNLWASTGQQTVNAARGVLLGLSALPHGHFRQTCLGWVSNWLPFAHGSASLTIRPGLPFYH